MIRKALPLLAAVIVLAASLPSSAALAAEELVLTPPSPSLQTKGEEDRDDHQSIIDKINGGNAAIMGALGKKDWTALAQAVPHTKDWREDLLAVAQTQVGYTEESSGMTHYTRWAGLDHPADWTALFISWTAEQAGLKEKQFPHGVSYDELRERLSTLGAVKKIRRAAYPVSGDLALIETKSEKHLGFIVYVSGGYASVILGDVNGSVIRTTYQVEGTDFKHYVDLNVLMERAGIEVGKGGRVPEIPAGGIAAWTNTNAVYLRSEPTTACKSLTTIKAANSAVLVTSAALEEDGYIWYGVAYNNLRGYVRGDLLTLDQAALSSSGSQSDDGPGLSVQERVVNIEVVQAGDDQLFNITFEVYGAAAYEWHEVRTTEKGATDRILDETGATLSLSAKTDAAYSYYCVATIISDGKAIEITSKPTVLDVTSEVSAPIVAETILGEEVKFTYTSQNAVSYQWYVQYSLNTAPYALYNGDVYTGVDASRLTFHALRAHADALYFCIAKDADGNEFRSRYYTLFIKDNASLTDEDLGKYVDELAHMTPNERHIALTQTWNITLDGSAATLADSVRTHWEQNLSAAYPNLLCTCGKQAAPGNAHSSSCPWYVNTSSGTSGYASCTTYADACTYAGSWLTRKAGPVEIYNHLTSLDADAQRNLIRHANAAHPQVAVMLCSCAGTEGTLAAPGSAHLSTCPWYLAEVDSSALAVRCARDAAFAQWAQGATQDMIARALTVDTLDHLIVSDGLLYVAREESPCAMVDQEGRVTDMMTGLVIAQIDNGVFSPVH